MKSQYSVLITLLSIIAIGLVGIPFGDPRFIGVAILVELLFVTLAIFVTKGYAKSFYICIIVASLIIVGNSLTTAHIQRMMTIVKPVNTIVLVIGGYVLQAFLSEPLGPPIKVLSMPDLVEMGPLLKLLLANHFSSCMFLDGKIS